MMARRAMGWTLAMAALAVIAAQPLAAQDHGAIPDVSGEWELSVMGGFGLLELTMDGHDISGFITMGDHGKIALHSAEFDGHELYFELTFEPGTMVFLSTVDGDEYIGEMSGPGMPATEFVAKRESR